MLTAKLTDDEARLLIDAGEFVMAGPDPWDSPCDRIKLERAVNKLKLRRSWETKRARRRGTNGA